MRKLHINFMNNLQNYEFAQLYKHICSTIDTEQLQDTQAQEAYRAVKAHAGEIAQMLPDTGSHTLTVVMNEGTHKRTDYLISIRKQVDGLKQSYSNEKRAAAVVLTYWLEQQGEKLYRASITLQSQLIKNLIHKREHIPEIDKAITFLGFDPDLAAIDELTQQIDANFMQRNKEMSARSKKSKTTRKAVYRDLKRLTGIFNNYLELDEDKRKDIIYDESIKNINKLLTHFHSQLKSRTTKTKTKKEITVAIDELIDNQVGAQKKILPDVANRKLESTPSTGLRIDELETPANVKLPNVTTERMNNKIPNSEDLSITNKDKDKGNKDGDIDKDKDEKLPPISSN